MILDLKNVFLNDGEHIEKNYELNMQDTTVSGENYFDSIVKVEAKVKNRAGLVNLAVNAKFNYSRPCDRCGSDTTKQMDCKFNHVLVVSLSGNQNDDYIQLPDYKLDLDELVRTDVLLEVPSKFLCKDSCKGICLKCGANLNLKNCGCDTRQIDPRFEVLRQLLD